MPKCLDHPDTDLVEGPSTEFNYHCVTCGNVIHSGSADHGPTLHRFCTNCSRDGADTREGTREERSRILRHCPTCLREQG